jgi:hypothetical protein
MDHNINTGFALNKQFVAIQKTIIDKRNKNESTSSETEWLIQQLYEENLKKCENAVNVLISTSDQGFVLNTFLSCLQKIKIENYFIIADGILRVLLVDIKKSDYECSFKIHQQVHPVIYLIDDSSEKMLFLSSKICSILNENDK